MSKYALHTISEYSKIVLRKKKRKHKQKTNTYKGTIYKLGT